MCETFSILFSGVFLNFLDIFIEIKFLNEPGMENYAILFFLSILVYNINISYFWWKWEKSRKWSWILVVLQIYPDAKSNWIYKKMTSEDTTENTEIKEKRNETMSLVNQYVKAIPQLLILSCYNVDTSAYVGGLGGLEGSTAYAQLSGLLIGVKFFISALTGVFGLIKLLHKGPGRVLPTTDEGYLKFILGYLVILCTVSTTFIGKGMALAVMVYLRGDTETYKYDKIWPAVTLWCVLYVVPQIIISTIILAWNLKTKFFYVLSTHIYLLLCPVFTNFSVGPDSGTVSDSWRPNTTWRKSGELPKSMKVSPALTTINVIITLAVHVCLLVEFKNRDYMKEELDKNFLGLNLDIFKYYVMFKAHAYLVYGASFFGGFCTIVFVNLNHFWKKFEKLDPKNLPLDPDQSGSSLEKV